MDFEKQSSRNSYNPSSSPNYVFVTAPTSPNEQNTMNNHYYHSAPTSPRRSGMFTNGSTIVFEENQETGDDQRLDFDGFEFETSKKFMSGPLHFETSRNLDDHAMENHREGGDSLPIMAFADELFVNGLVMPLKPPPRLQCDVGFSFNSFSQKSPGVSSKSPKTVCRIPFGRRNAWNDDFDPFMAALEKVREEKRGRNSSHRRSRSYSPFRGMSKCSSDLGPYDNEDMVLEPIPVQPPSHSGPLEFKGSAYARWVRDQTRERGFTPRGTKSPRWFPFGQRVRPVRTEQDVVQEKEDKDKNSGIVKDENNTKVLRLKAVLMRYASFRGDSVSKEKMNVKKPSYFSRLSFKFRGNVLGIGKKKKNTADISMAVVEYKPSLAF